MKNTFLYIVLGIFCFGIGYFALNEVVTSTDRTTYSEMVSDEGKNEGNENIQQMKVYINNVEVSNLSSDSALEKLNNKIDMRDEVLTINVENEQYSATFEQLSLKYNYGNAIKQSQREASDNILSINAEIVYNEETINNIVAELKEQCDVPVENDEIKFENEQFVVTTRNEGKILNEQKAIEEIKTALNNGEKTISLQLETVTNDEMLENINEYMVEIGGFSTKYTGSSSGRITNLKVAGSSLDGTYVYPGEVFSTNNNFAPYTTEKGYANGSIILNGELVDGLGGGVCQVSSTLYNALLYAELDIIEKYNHSLKVGYIDYGFDAVLASTYKDLKFINDTTKPVYIKTFVGDGIISVAIYGEEVHDPNRVVKFSNEHVSSTAPSEPVLIENEEMYIGEEEVKVKPLHGHVYNVYKHIYNGEEYIDTEFVAKNVYKSRAEQRYVGIKEPEEVVVVEEVQENNDSEIIVETPIENNDEAITEIPVPEENDVEDVVEEPVQDEENIAEEDTVVEIDESIEFNDEGLVVNNEEIQEIIAENEEIESNEEAPTENSSNN